MVGLRVSVFNLDCSSVYNKAHTEEKGEDRSLGSSYSLYIENLNSALVDPFEGPGAPNQRVGYAFIPFILADYILLKILK